MLRPRGTLPAYGSYSYGGGGGGGGDGGYRSYRGGRGASAGAALLRAGVRPRHALACACGFMCVFAVLLLRQQAALDADAALYGRAGAWQQPEEPGGRPGGTPGGGGFSDGYRPAPPEELEEVDDGADEQARVRACVSARRDGEGSGGGKQRAARDENERVRACALPR
jgi:hypothetical protein